jgi:hypothetical protein
VVDIWGMVKENFVAVTYNKSLQPSHKAYYNELIEDGNLVCYLWREGLDV